jgi:uncharacterized membrane protein
VTVLAQGSSGVFWISIVALLVVTVIGFVVAMRLRARAFDRSALDAESFGFSELRALRDSGRISDDEYEIAERRLREKARETVERLRQERASAKPPAVRGSRRSS